jgi:hypothetical protein
MYSPGFSNPQLFIHTYNHSHTHSDTYKHTHFFIKQTNFLFYSSLVSIPCPREFLCTLEVPNIIYIQCKSYHWRDRQLDNTCMYVYKEWNAEVNFVPHCNTPHRTSPILLQNFVPHSYNMSVVLVNMWINSNVTAFFCCISILKLMK